MDLNKALRELHEEKKRLDRAIHALEAGRKASSSTPARMRRGRRMMSAEERREVSKRMSAYWRAKRAQNAKAKASQPLLAAGESMRAAATA
jgi:bisphosphoglycerate-dependent phosphoglycerate mutase